MCARWKLPCAAKRQRKQSHVLSRNDWLKARGEAPAALAASHQFGLFQGPFAGLLDLTAVMIEVAERADTTLADVQGSAEAYAAFQRELLPYKQALDLWVSQWFDEGPTTNDEDH